MAKERSQTQTGASPDKAKKQKPKAAGGKAKSGPSKSGSAAARSSQKSKPNDDRDQRIRQRAYELWEQEGRPAGREGEHWNQANRDVKE